MRRARSSAANRTPEPVPRSHAFAWLTRRLEWERTLAGLRAVQVAAAEVQPSAA